MTNPKRKTQPNQLSIAQFYLDENMAHRFKQTIDSSTETIRKQRIQDATYFQTLFELEQKKAHFDSAYNNYSDDANLIRANQSLDAYFTIKKLELSVS
ncbi:MAG: hypothetical protein R2792_19745 [Saprospiraceae bacterium]